jgi:hypothetical protein
MKSYLLPSQRVRTAQDGDRWMVIQVSCYGKSEGCQWFNGQEAAEAVKAEKIHHLTVELAMMDRAREEIDAAMKAIAL